MSLLLALILSGTPDVQAQAPAATGYAAAPATITDPGELYSTYNLGDDASARSAILSQTSSATLQDVLLYSNERAWPSGIATLDGRLARRAQIQQYRVYAIARFADKFVLRVPAGENGHMPSDMRPSRDIYFIIGADGVSGNVAPVPAAPAGDVEQLNATINNPGDLYSTNNLSNDAAALSAIQAQTSPALAQDIITYSNERSWPSGIATLDGRLARREQIQQYRVYIIARFSDKYVLRVPATENGHMPADMRPSRDIYFIFGQKGVTAGAPAGGVTGGSVGGTVGGTGTSGASGSGGLGFGRPVASVAPTPAPTPTVAPTPTPAATPIYPSGPAASSFPDALSALVAAFPRNFEPVRGAAMEEAGSYTSRQPLPGAQKTYVYQDMMARSNRLHASYGSWRTEAEGRAAYRDLVAQVNAARLACCTLAASEKVEANGAYTSWVPTTGSADYQGMVIEVQLTKMPGLDENMKLIEEWALMLRIYRI